MSLENKACVFNVVVNSIILIYCIIEFRKIAPMISSSILIALNLVNIGQEYMKLKDRDR